MALYVPPLFAAPRDALALALIDEHPFAMLVTPGDGDASVTHLPLLRDGDELIGHVARANPHWRALPATDSIAIFHGPHAYVSPTWYATPATMVPTWNYAVAHVRGRARLIEDERGCERVLERLVERFEDTDAGAWRFALTGAQRAAMLRAIVAFRLPMTVVTAKLKLSQNRDAGDRARVRAALAQSADAQAQATAAWMHRLDEADDGRA